MREEELTDSNELRSLFQACFSFFGFCLFVCLFVFLIGREKKGITAVVPLQPLYAQEEPGNVKHKRPSQ